MGYIRSRTELDVRLRRIILGQAIDFSVASKFAHIADAQYVSAKLFLHLEVEHFEICFLLVNRHWNHASAGIKRCVRCIGHIQNRNREPTGHERPARMAERARTATASVLCSDSACELTGTRKVRAVVILKRTILRVVEWRVLEVVVRTVIRGEER